MVHLNHLVMAEMLPLCVACLPLSFSVVLRHFGAANQQHYGVADAAAEPGPGVDHGL
jgi:hypothetical protein